MEQKNEIVSKRFVAMFKRQVPQFRYLKTAIDLSIDFQKVLAENNPKLLRDHKHWPVEIKDKIKYYHLTPVIFNRIVNNETHFTYFELLAVADIIGCNLELVFTKKVK